MHSTKHAPTPINLDTAPVRSWSWPISIPELLSTTWIAVLLADVLRGIHETLRPGFIQELATQGTVYGNDVTDAELAVYGVVLGFLSVVVVLARILPRRWNRVVNIAASLMMMSGVLLSWPKDPDDLVFGTVQLAGSVLVFIICVRWTEDRLRSSGPTDQPQPTTSVHREPVSRLTAAVAE